MRLSIKGDLVSIGGHRWEHRGSVQQDRQKLSEDKMKKPAWFVFCVGITAVLLGGCIISTGVMPVEADTYSVMVSSRDKEHSTRNAYLEATEACKNQDRDMLVVHEEVTEESRTYFVKLIFKCLPKDDPALQGQPAAGKEPGAPTQAPPE